MRVDLGVPREMMAGHIDCFLVQRVGHRAVDFVGVGKLNDFFDILESRFSRFDTDLADKYEARLEEQARVFVAKGGRLPQY